MSKNLTWIGIFGLTSLILGGVVLAHGVSPASFVHGGHGGDHLAIFHLIRDLDLSDQQVEQLDALHASLAEARRNRLDGRGEHASRLLAKLESGDALDAADARDTIDQHLEQFRHTAYALADGVVGLLNSLDTEQRAKVAAHLSRVAEDRSEEGSAERRRGLHGHSH